MGRRTASCIARVLPIDWKYAESSVALLPAYEVGDATVACAALVEPFSGVAVRRGGSMGAPSVLPAPLDVSP